MDATNGRVLPDLTQLDRSALEALVSQMQHKLRKQATARLRLAVSEKGALSVYGIQRFPVTLYREQWERLLDYSDSIREFIADNQDTLTTKG